MCEVNTQRVLCSWRHRTTHVMSFFTKGRRKKHLKSLHKVMSALPHVDVLLVVLDSLCLLLMCVAENTLKIYLKNNENVFFFFLKESFLVINEIKQQKSFLGFFYILSLRFVYCSAQNRLTKNEGNDPKMVGFAHLTFLKKCILGTI